MACATSRTARKAFSISYDAAPLYHWSFRLLFQARERYHYWCCSLLLHLLLRFSAWMVTDSPLLLVLSSWFLLLWSCNSKTSLTKVFLQSQTMQKAQQQVLLLTNAVPTEYSSNRCLPEPFPTRATSPAACSRAILSTQWHDRPLLPW